MHNPKSEKVPSEAAPGDDRTHKIIGQVKYADDKTPRAPASAPTPERQGGVGGPMTPKTTAANNAGLQDDHDPNDVGQKSANKSKAEKSQMEGPAAYAPHEEEEIRAFPNRDPAKKKTGEF